MKVKINDFLINSNTDQEFVMVIIAAILNKLEAKGFLNTHSSTEHLYKDLNNLTSSLDSYKLEDSPLESIANHQNVLKISERFNNFIKNVKGITKQNGSKGLKIDFYMDSEQTDRLNLNLVYLKKLYPFELETDYKHIKLKF